MTQPPHDPYGPPYRPPVVPGHQQPRGWPPQPPQPAKKKPGPLAWILGSIAAVLALCVGLTVIIGVTSGGEDDSAKQAAAVVGSAATTGQAQPTTASPSPAAPKSAALPPKSATTKAAAAVTTKPKPSSTSTKPKPKPTTAKPKPKPTPTSDPTHAGVTAGAFCDDHGDYGLTSKGTLMQCKTSATDSRYRWRKA